MNEIRDTLEYVPAFAKAAREGVIDLEPLEFVLDTTNQRLTRRDWVKAEKENKARRIILQNVFLDRDNEPLERDEIARSTGEARRNFNSLLGDNRSAVFGLPTSHCIVLEKEGERYLAAHFFHGQLETLAQINLEEGSEMPTTRVVFTQTHEGKIESSQEGGYELTRTATHAFNFLVGRTRGKPNTQVPKELGDQIEQERETPDGLLLRKGLFEELNQRYGEPLKDGGILVIADTKIGSPLASLRETHRRFLGLPALSEVDTFLQVLLCRGDEALAEKVKAFGHTSRGDGFTQATILAATIGNRTEAKPVFPGYNPYYQHNEKGDPARVSPTALAILELGKAKAEGKEAVFVDHGPTTERNYAAIIKLAQEEEVDISKVPGIFSVGVKVKENQAELVDSKLLNYNYSLDDDCRRGLALAIGHFEDLTFFSFDTVNVGIPLDGFEDFVEFMKRFGGGEYQEMGEKLLLRAKHGSSMRSAFETIAIKEMGEPLGLPKKSFPAQDTLVGAYLSHPEWFEVEEMPLKYVDEKGANQEKRVKVINQMTDEGRSRFSDWLWICVKANFGEVAESQTDVPEGTQFNLQVGFDGPNTKKLTRRHPELLDHPDVLPTFDVVNSGQKTAVVRIRGVDRRPVNVREGNEQFFSWYQDMFPASIQDGVSFIHVTFPQHTYSRELIVKQVEDFLESQGVENIHIAAISYGGTLAFDLARDIHINDVGINVASMSFLSGLTNEQELTPVARKARKYAGSAVEVPRMLGFPTRVYAHTRALGVRTRDIPKKPFKAEEMPPGVKVFLACPDHDRIVDTPVMVRNVKSIYPDTTVLYLKGWHSLPKAQQARGYKEMADFITDQIEK